ncbi:MAG TPA: Rho termination factor N-terminal domain-containing protein, partial [Thermoleophilaceae bacterium]|nr:Rho termination factor N-terminal domain-containing protein [Thermoleophilaceae bacterium]
MPVLERTELEKSPLSDLHTLASELGVEGYRRLRKDDLIDAIVGSQGEEAPAEAESGGGEATAGDEAPERSGDSRRRRGGRGRGRRREAASEDRSRDESSGEEAAEEDAAEEDAGEEEPRTGTLDILPNGSGFLRADPFAHAPDDVYVSPAQVRRFELRTGDELAGPVRSPRRSERYPSLVRVESVNGGPAEPPAERPLFSDLTACFARERLSAPEELEGTPFGKGSRVAVAGPPGAGATTLLRRIAATLAERHPEVDLTVVLAGVRPEEVPEWRAQVQAPVAGGSFDESAERQGEIAS